MAEAPIHIDEAACKGCGKCVKGCGFGAISMVEAKGANKAGKLAVVDASACKACGACFKMGCPAMTRGKEIRPGAFQMVIDPNQCAGCKQCGQVCKFGAIKRVR